MSELTIHATRAHERVHVRQCELWGLLFLLVYPIAGVWAWSKGGHPYRDNRFELAARRADKQSC